MKMLSFKHLQLAIGFYSRFPVSRQLDYAQLSQAAFYLPIVGWLVGASCALAFYLALLLWSKSIAIIIALIVGVLLTGGLHEDGFADVCDGFGGGYDKAQILAIMKDSHSGVYALLGLLLLFALKVSVLNELPSTAIPWLLLTGHSLSRLAPLFIMYSYDYMREQDSKAKPAVSSPSVKQMVWATGFAGLPLLSLPLWHSVIVILLVLLINACLGRYFYRRIGGYTGDCLGASQQIAEVIFYLIVSSLWKFI